MIPLLALLCFACPAHAAISIVSHSYIPQSAGCANGGGTGNPCTFSLTVSNTGDTVLYWVSECVAASCNFAATSFTASDGTNTFTQVTASSVIGTVWNKVLFICNNATAGTYTETVSYVGGSATGSYYSQIEKVELSGTNTSSPIDTSVGNETNGNSASPSITSAGNVAAASEIVLASFSGAANLSNSGSYTTLDLNNTDGNGTVYVLNPSSGATTTAAMSQSSAAWYASMVAIKPASAGGVVRRRAMVIQ
jgi:hypothetical protein